MSSAFDANKGIENFVGPTVALSPAGLDDNFVYPDDPATDLDALDAAQTEAALDRIFAALDAPGGVDAVGAMLALLDAAEAKAEEVDAFAEVEPTTEDTVAMLDDLLEATQNNDAELEAERDAADEIDFFWRLEQLGSNDGDFFI